MRKVTVMLAFECDVEDFTVEPVAPAVVGQNLCQYIQTPGQIGNPNWVATPHAVGFIRATAFDDDDTPSAAASALEQGQQSGGEQP